MKFVGLAVWMSVLLLGLYYVWQQVWLLEQSGPGLSRIVASMPSIIYNTVNHPRELLLSVNPDQPMFWDHFNPGVLAFMPLWLLWPDFKMIDRAAGRRHGRRGTAALLDRPTRLSGKDRGAVVGTVAWLVYPSTSQLIYSASYGFHWGNVCLPLYFFALALWMRGCKGWALAAVIWALLMKEEAAIVIGMFGLYLAIFERRCLLGVAITAFAFGYFLIVTTLVIPPAKLGYYVQMRFFADLGQNTWEILLSPLIKPRVFWGRLFESRSWYFAAALLAPLLFIPLKKPSILFVGSLTFVFVCMHPIMKSISYQYQAALLPVVFWALAAALQKEETPKRRGDSDWRASHPAHAIPVLRQHLLEQRYDSNSTCRLGDWRSCNASATKSRRATRFSPPSASPPISSNNAIFTRTIPSLPTSIASSGSARPVAERVNLRLTCAVCATSSDRWKGFPVCISLPQKMGSCSTRAEAPRWTPAISSNAMPCPKPSRDDPLNSVTESKSRASPSPGSRPPTTAARTLSV